MRKAAAAAVALLLAGCAGDGGDARDGAPGDLLGASVRRADDVPDGARAWDIRHLSAGPGGDLVEVTGVVYAPGRMGGDRPVVTWAHGTTGIGDGCAPSRRGVHVPWLPRLLDAGYVVVATDYQGLGTPGPHPYLVGRSEARSVLDAARAAGGMRAAGAGRRVVVLGHSQGGHAALFTAEVASRYAPDLDVVGSAAVAPVADVEAFLATARASPRTFGIFAATAVAWSQTYDDLELGDVLSDTGIRRARRLAGACGSAFTRAFVDGDLAALRGQSPASVPGWRARLAANQPGRLITSVPLLVVNGTADPVVAPWTTDRAVDRLCHTGSVVEYRRYSGADHGSVLAAGRDDVLAWMAARVAGLPPASRCVRWTG